MYLGCRFLPIRVRGIFSYPLGKKWITSISMYPSTVKVGLEQMEGRLERLEGRLERMEGRLFDMQRSLTIQTRWLLTFLVAAPVIYGVVQKLLGLLP
jgi:hypothetical protein